MINVLEYIEEKNKKNKIALKDENSSCTFEELMEIGKKVGTEIAKYTNQRMPVAILMEKGIDAINSFVGTIYAGCFYVYLNSDLPKERLKTILETVQADVILTDEANLELAKELNVRGEKILEISKLKEAKIDVEKLSKIRKQALDVDPLYANFTSGSTGTPKGVIVSHRSVIDFINIFTDKFNITNEDIIANQAPFDFDVSVKDIYSCFKTGATLVIVPKKLFSLPAKLLDYICENNVTTMIWAVSALCLITTFHGLDYKIPETVNKILFSGEVMPMKHLKSWVEHLPNATFVNLYGPTEITCNCTYHIVDKELKYEKQLPIGETFENEQVFLLNNENKLVENRNEIGEICVKGTALALGYYNNLEQTNEKFVQNPLNNKYYDLIYKTGDLGYYDDKNDLYFAGRKDFQIKHMGHRIELEEIERTMDKIGEIVRSCCIYREEKSKIYAFYVGNIDKTELNKKLREILPVFMVPNVFMKIDEFQLNKNGKIDRNILRQIIEQK